MRFRGAGPPTMFGPCDRATDCRGNLLQAHTFLVATAAPTMTDSLTLNIVDDRHRQVPQATLVDQTGPLGRIVLTTGGIGNGEVSLRRLPFDFLLMRYTTFMYGCYSRLHWFCLSVGSLTGRSRNFQHALLRLLGSLFPYLKMERSGVSGLAHPTGTQLQLVGVSRSCLGRFGAHCARAAEGPSATAGSFPTASSVASTAEKNNDAGTALIVASILSLVRFLIRIVRAVVQSHGEE